MSATKPSRVAVVGGGVAGLGCSWLASRDDTVRVDLFEAGKFGGHADTFDLVRPHCEYLLQVD